MSLLPKGDSIQIRDVWNDNLEEEFALIREIVDDYPYIAMDTEFPGIVLRPVGNFKNINEYHYQTLKDNVDMLKLIQLGLTFSDEHGNLPTCGTDKYCIWQFNFREFNVNEDVFANDSIELLRQSGIDFKKNNEKGIDAMRFGELLMSSGIVLNDSVHWVTFHSGYDFGYFFVINNRDIIPIPFAQPDGDIEILIGDWYTRNHTALKTALESGQDLGMPDGVLINGKGPYRYNTTLVPDGIQYETINVDPGKTYRFRVHNVGTSTSLNFRIQGHKLLLVETEGHYTVQQNFTSFDIHVGQSYSFLVTMDQNATSDYYLVASARFVNESLWQRVTGVAILHYSNSKGPAAGPLPDAPSDIYNQWSAMNQPKSIRQNTTASGARPNPQGSFHYGTINITDTYVIRSLPPVTIGGKLRATLNGISFVNPDTPIRLADLHNVKGAYKLDFPNEPLDRPPQTDASVMNATYKGFIEVILQNNDTRMQSFHMDGYSFFVVAMDWGVWTEDKRGTYNKWDAISRCTVEVYPGAWTAVLVSLDNVGVWNLRVENLDRWYLGQETYMRIVNPEENGKTEMAPPDNVRYCGALQYLQKEQNTSAAISNLSGKWKMFFALMMALCAAVFVSN